MVEYLLALGSSHNTLIYFYLSSPMSWSHFKQSIAMCGQLGVSSCPKSSEKSNFMLFSYHFFWGPFLHSPRLSSVSSSFFDSSWC